MLIAGFDRNSEADARQPQKRAVIAAFMPAPRRG